MTEGDRWAVRHTKGRQIPVTLYMSPKQYWLLKAVSRNTGFPMQFLLRRALEMVLKESFTSGLPGGKSRAR